MLRDRLLTESQRAMSVASYVETGTVLAGRLRTNRIQAVEGLYRFLDTVGIILAPVDEDQARQAPVLFIGDDFGTMDVVPAVGPTTG